MITAPTWADLLCDWVDAPVSIAVIHTSDDITTATVTARGRKYFCKATPADQNEAVQTLRIEAAASIAHRQAAAPFHGLLEGHGWVALVFDHIDGRHARLYPAAVGIALADRITNLIRTPADASAATGLPPVTARFSNTPGWDRLQDEHPNLVWSPARGFLDDGQQSRMALLEGAHIAHTDLHCGNIIVNDQDITIIDWGWAATAAPWFDQALLGVQLIAAGASTARVINRLRRRTGHPCSADELTAFAIEMSRYWIGRTVAEPAEQHLWHLIEAAGRLAWQLRAPDFLAPKGQSVPAGHLRP